ncbi:glycosyltransferase [Pseudoalteromonas sp. GB56]
MKITHITTVHNAFDNRIYYKECQWLAKKGLDVTLVAPGENEEFKGAVKVLPLGKKHKGLLGRLRMVMKAYRTAVTTEADIYHIHDPELLILKPLFLLKRKCLVYDAHEAFHEQLLLKPSIPKAFRGASRLLAKLYERILIGKGPVVFAETDYKNNYPYVDKFKFALNLPDVDTLTKLTKTDKGSSRIDIGYVGSITYARGCLTVLEELVEIKKANSELQLGYICIGPFNSPDIQGKLEALGAQLDYFYAPGYMKFEDASNVIKDCHVGCAVLDRTPNYISSYPTKIFEYMALGIPFLVSDFPINRQIVEEEECGLLVEPESRESINKALLSLIQDNELRGKLGNNGKNNIHKYSWEEQVNNIIAGYRDWV